MLRINLVSAAERRLAEERDALMQDARKVARSARVCSVCESAILRRGNTTGVCQACQRNYVSTRRCPKCGDPLDARNRQGVCRSCPRV